MAKAKVKKVSEEYVDTLNYKERDRYLQKTALIGFDPYKSCKDDWDTDVDNFPSVAYIDIVNYLITSTSPYTMSDLKAYKSLDAYNYFVSGHVRDASCVMKNGYCVVTAKVSHSQKAREKPLWPWVITEPGGTVVTGHCTCMAGLGEVCSHVAALLFLIDSTVRIRESKTVTQQKAYWMLPSQSREVQYKPICDIDFTSASTMKQHLDKKITNISPNSTPMKMPKTPRKLRENICEPVTDEEFDTFLESISKCNIKPSILSLIDPYSNHYIPKSEKGEFPTPLIKLYDEKCLSFNFCELLLHCKQIDIKMTTQEANNVEEHTREQSQSKLWYTYRAGRITASRFKSVCHSDPGYPSQSLIKAICYPESYKFKTAATVWGCEHEKMAQEVYVEVMKKKHINFRVSNCGLFINPLYAFLGASPDGIRSCDCCESGCLEIKCPFCKRHDFLNEDTSNGSKNFCLQNINQKLELMKNHAYYYQVQCQINVTGYDFCDFVVWTEKDIHIEKIPINIDFWNENLGKARLFFANAILPELVAKFYSRPPTSNILIPISTNTQYNCDNEDDDYEVWCFYRMAKNTQLIGCDNENCEFQWFHFECVGILESKPKGKWYCPNCRKMDQFKRGRKRTFTVHKQ